MWVHQPFRVCTHSFPSSEEDRNTKVFFVYGISGVVRDGVVQLIDPSNLGSVVWDNSFTLDAGTQTFLLDACSDVAALTFVARDVDNPVVGVVRGQSCGRAGHSRRTDCLELG